MVLFHPVRTLFFHPIRTFTAGALGAAAAYLLDPKLGEERRAQLAEQIKTQVNNLREGSFPDVRKSEPEPVLIPPATTSVTDLTDTSTPQEPGRTDAEIPTPGI